MSADVPALAGWDGVTVWLSDVSREDWPWDEWLAALSADERERAGRFHFPSDAELWRRGRAFVRHVIGAALGRGPADLCFVRDERDRPSIAGAPAELDVNWSHSGPWLALAFSQHGRVGIDVERHDGQFPIAEVAPGVFGPEELAWMQAGEPRERFYALWTAKEALMKATGLGVALEPREIRVEIGPDGRLAGYASHPDWTLHQLEAPAGVALTLARRRGVERAKN